MMRAVGKRLAEGGAALASNLRRPDLRRAQLAFGSAYAAEWSLTVALGVVAFRDGGAAAVGAAAVVMAVDLPTVFVYVLAVIATIPFTAFRPAHSALLPALCETPTELTAANASRGLLDSASIFVGPLLAALLLGISGPEAVFVLTAGVSPLVAPFVRPVGYQ